jgi:hypothetical protein
MLIIQITLCFFNADNWYATDFESKIFIATYNRFRLQQLMKHCYSPDFLKQTFLKFVFVSLLEWFKCVALCLYLYVSILYLFN